MKLSERIEEYINYIEKASALHKANGTVPNAALIIKLMLLIFFIGGLTIVLMTVDIYFLGHFLYYMSIIYKPVSFLDSFLLAFATLFVIYLVYRIQDIKEKILTN